ITDGYLGLLAYSTLLGSPLLACWTAALLVTRLRAPWPPRRHVWHQPGFLACVAVSFAIAWTIVADVVGILAGFLQNRALWGHFRYEDSVYPTVRKLYFYSHDGIAGAVLLVWLVTWAGGRSRAEPSWVDRCGRLVGVLWVATWLLPYIWI